MTQREDDTRFELRARDDRQGLKTADIMAVLAVAMLLATIGLLTFVLTTAFAA